MPTDTIQNQITPEQAKPLLNQLNTAQGLLNNYKANNQPIDASKLGNVTQINLPDQKYTPTTNNLAIANNSTVGNIQTDANAVIPEPTPVQNDKSQLIRGYLDKFLNTDIGKQENDIIDTSGLADKKAKAQGVSNELDQLDKSYLDKVKSIKENKQGLFGGAVEDQINKAQDEYQNNRANISLTYKVANDDYQGTQDIVNQKISSLKDTQAQQLQAYGLLKDSFYNDLTESEKQQADQQFQIQQTQAKANQDAYSTVLQNAVQNGAPASVLSALDSASRDPNATPASIAASVGRYGVDTLRQLQIEKARADLSSSGEETGDTTESSNESIVNKIDDINALLSNTKGLSASVGTTGIFGRGGNTDFGSAKGEFNAGIQTLTSQLTLDNLINAKARGATFGALSEGELNILAGGATKLNTWAKKDKNGNIVGFTTSEANVKRELDRINNFAKKDFILKGGDPAQVGASQLPDGTLWVKNSDGTLTQLN